MAKWLEDQPLLLTTVPVNPQNFLIPLVSNFGVRKVWPNCKAKNYSKLSYSNKRIFNVPVLYEHIRGTLVLHATIRHVKML